jgi:cell division protein FtsX
LSYAIKLIYFFLEAAVAFWRHKALHGFALFVVTLSLYILGFSQYLTGNVNALLKSWETNLEVRVFLEDKLPEDKIQELAQSLGREDAVASVQVITPQEGLKVLAKIAPAFGALSEDLGENPLPAALSLRLKSPLNLERVRRLVDKAGHMPGVAQVLFDWDWVQRLRTYSRFVSLLGWILFGALGVAAVFTVAAITRIIVLSRREEIAILHFVGATSASIRGPFIAGGALLGFFAGVLALLLVLSSHLVLHAAAGSDTLFLQWVSRAFLSTRDQALLVMTGTALGALGGLTSLGSLEHWS